MNGQMMDKIFERETPDLQNIITSQLSATDKNKAVMQLLRQTYLPECDSDIHAMSSGIQTTEFLHLHNPRNYKFLPAHFTDRIRESGKLASRHTTRDIITN